MIEIIIIILAPITISSALLLYLVSYTVNKADIEREEELP